MCTALRKEILFKEHACQIRGGRNDNADNPQYTDLHHLFPSDQYVNNKKSNNIVSQTLADMDSIMEVKWDMYLFGAPLNGTQPLLF